jgi:ABC-2 type transport system ATP-binding protein
VCSRAIVIAKGKMIADGTPSDLERRSSYYNAVSVRLHRDHVASLKEALGGISDIERIETGDDVGETAHVVVMPKNSATIIETVNARMKDRSIVTEQLYVERGRLEDVFRQLTGDEQGGEK